MNQRTIKFRAYNIVTKQMSPPFSVFGGNPKVKGFPNDECYFMQFTGLLDKNGKEIWEGDVFKDDEWWVGRAVVTFHDGVFGWWSDGNEEFISLNSCKNREVIGNIYENSDLIPSPTQTANPYENETGGFGDYLADK